VTKVRARHVRCSSPPDKVRASWPSSSGSRATRSRAMLSSCVPAPGRATARFRPPCPGTGWTLEHHAYPAAQDQRVQLIQRLAAIMLP
jgi:hypothetical protein